VLGHQAAGHPPGGLDYHRATDTLTHLMTQARRLGITGTTLKDDLPTLPEGSAGVGIGGFRRGRVVRAACSVTMGGCGPRMRRSRSWNGRPERLLAI
jgi:hypothetical protein